MQINLDRLKSTLLDLSRIGFNEADKGIYLTSFSESDMAARRWLMQTLETEGFRTEMDGAGNVYGRLGTNGKPTITIGSHLDTVPARRHVRRRARSPAPRQGIDPRAQSSG